MLKFMRRSHRRRLAPRLEAFERVIESWCTVAPSRELRLFTMQRISAFRGEAADLLSTGPTVCATRPEWRRPLSRPEAT
jgi:hypothetical protein